MAYTMTHILIAEKVLEDIKMPVDYSTYIVEQLPRMQSMQVRTTHVS